MNISTIKNSQVGNTTKLTVSTVKVHILFISTRVKIYYFIIHVAARERSKASKGAPPLEKINNIPYPEGIAGGI